MPDNDATANTTSSPGSSAAMITRKAERQSPAHECGGGEPLDVTRPDNGEAAGGRGHFPCSRTDERVTSSDASDKPVTESPKDVQEPVAWAAVAKNGKPMWLSYSREGAEGAVFGAAEVVPLYRTPPTCPHVVGRTTLYCSLTPLADQERTDLQSEIDRLRTAIRSLAEQDATLSVHGGNVTVTFDATLTDAEREAIQTAAMIYEQGAKHMGHVEDGKRAATLRGLLDRMS